MRVVVDSHALYFYVFSPERLSEPALEALGESEDSDGIVVSVASLGDLWYVDNKSHGSPFPPGAFDSLRQVVLDPARRSTWSRSRRRRWSTSTGCRRTRYPTRSIGSFWRQQRSCACRW